VNHQDDDWPRFYVEHRLNVQLRMSRDAGLLSGNEIPGENVMVRTVENLCPNVTPSLIHGDLWGGNYLISSEGIPCLIDPAIYYGHHEVDLAMSRLFGGFDTGFYSAYHELMPYAPGSEERNDIYQLYYLLVHLNLFGPSYYHRVKQLLTRYFT
jgi:fructosamine-3-kinase